MVDSLVPEALQQRLGNQVHDAQETLHTEALMGFTSGGIPALQAAWPVQTGCDIANLTQLRNTLELVVIPALNAAIAGVPGPFDGGAGGQADPASSIVEHVAVI